MDSFDHTAAYDVFIDDDGSFFDAEGGILPFYSSWNFDLSSLDKYLVVDSCEFVSFLDIEGNDIPSRLACTAGLLGNIDLLPQHLVAAFPIVFDTSASLAISPCQDYFVPSSITNCTINTWVD